MVLPFLNEEELAKYIPHKGHRILARKYTTCARGQNSSPTPPKPHLSLRKDDLIERIKGKMAIRGISPKALKRKAPNERTVEIGWSHFQPITGKYAMVRKSNGGGTRYTKLSVEKTMRDVREIAMEIFGLEEDVCIGKLSTDQHGHNRLGMDVTVQQVYEELKMKTIRIYILTENNDDTKDTLSTTHSVDDDSFLVEIHSLSSDMKENFESSGLGMIACESTTLQHCSPLPTQPGMSTEGYQHILSGPVSETRTAEQQSEINTYRDQTPEGHLTCLSSPAIESVTPMNQSDISTDQTPESHRPILSLPATEIMTPTNQAARELHSCDTPVSAPATTSTSHSAYLEQPLTLNECQSSTSVLPNFVHHTGDVNNSSVTAADVSGMDSSVVGSYTDMVDMSVFTQFGSPGVFVRKPENLKDALYELNMKTEDLSVGKANIVNVMRDDVLDGGLRAFKRQNFNPNNKLNVRFIGEQAIDNGGPTKEFLRLALREVERRFFDGPPTNKTLVLNSAGEIQ